MKQFNEEANQNELIKRSKDKTTKQETELINISKDKTTEQENEDHFYGPLNTGMIMDEPKWSKKGKKQEKLSNSVNKHVKTVNEKKDGISTIKETSKKENKEIKAAAPSYISWEGNYKEKNKDDSRKMQDVKAALERYKTVKGSIHEAKALREIIIACNTYCWMKFSLFKFGKAKERLDEVKEIRKKAQQELGRSLYKDVKTFENETEYNKQVEEKPVKKKPVEEEKKKGKLEMIYNEDADSYREYLRNKSSMLKNGISVAVPVMLAPAVGLLHALTMPFRYLTKGINKLVRYSQKKMGIKQSPVLLDPFERLTIRSIRVATLKVLNGDPILSKSVKKKEKLMEQAGEKDKSLYEVLLSEKDEKGEEDNEELKKVYLEEDASFAMERFPIVKKELEKLKRKNTGRMTEEQKNEHQQAIENAEAALKGFKTDVNNYIDYATNNNIDIDTDRYQVITSFKLTQTEEEKVEETEKKTVEKTEKETEEKKEEEKVEETEKKTEEKTVEEKAEEKEKSAGDITVENHVPYEVQGYNNCFACSGTDLLNQFIYNEEKKLEKPYTQMDLRGYELPGYKAYKDIKNPLIIGRDIYDSKVTSIKNMLMPKSTDMGNIFELGDFFITKRKDIAVNRMVFNSPKIKDGMSDEELESALNKRKDYQNRFMTHVREVLKTGNHVSVLHNDHYVTIIGIEGEKLKVLDSYQLNMEKRDVNKPVLVTPEDLMTKKKATGEPDPTVEITWLSKIKDPEEITKGFRNLKYDEDTGFKNTASADEQIYNDTLVSQTQGVCVEESLEGTNGDIVKSVYVPKNIH